jgi:AcrR family transcriptional regulator
MPELTAYPGCRLVLSLEINKFCFTIWYERINLLPVPFPAKTSPDAIVQSAAELIQTNGLAALSMRTLAARLGVRASSLYRHFPDRSSIERTLANRAAEQLLDCLQLSIQGSTGEKAVVIAARAYLEYASTQESFYDVLMQVGPPQNGQSAETKGIWDFFIRLVSTATEFDGDVAGAAALWSLLHGFAVLSRSGQMGELNPRMTFARGTQALIRGLSVAGAEAVTSAS